MRKDRVDDLHAVERQQIVELPKKVGEGGKWRREVEWGTRSNLLLAWAEPFSQVK